MQVMQLWIVIFNYRNSGKVHKGRLGVCARNVDVAREKARKALEGVRLVSYSVEPAQMELSYERF